MHVYDIQTYEETRKDLKKSYIYPNRYIRPYIMSCLDSLHTHHHYHHHRYNKCEKRQRHKNQEQRQHIKRHDIGIKAINKSRSLWKRDLVFVNKNINSSEHHYFCVSLEDYSFLTLNIVFIFQFSWIVVDIYHPMTVKVSPYFESKF